MGQNYKQQPIMHSTLQASIDSQIHNNSNAHRTICVAH